MIKTQQQQIHALLDALEERLQRAIYDIAVVYAACPFCDCHVRLREAVKQAGCGACKDWEAERERIWNGYVEGKAENERTRAPGAANCRSPLKTIEIKEILL